MYGSTYPINNNIVLAFVVTIKIHLSVCTKLDTAIRLDNMEKGIDDFHSVSIRLLSELCALQSCDRLCDDIINEFSRESAVLLQTSLSHQPGLLGAYLQHGIGAIGHNFPVATHPSRNSTLGQTLPYSSGDRYDAGESLFRTQFPPGNQSRGQHLPVGGADITSVLNSSTHDIKALGNLSHLQLQGSMNGQMRVDKGVTQCMVYSCRNLSEPCKRKLKLCSEHKVRKRQASIPPRRAITSSHSNTYVPIISLYRELHRCDCTQMPPYSATAGTVTCFTILMRSLRTTYGLSA